MAHSCADCNKTATVSRFVKGERKFFCDTHDPKKSENSSAAK